MKIIVTGANGFVGSHLLKTLSDNGEHVIAVVRNEHERIENIKDIPGVNIIYCELDDIENLSALIGNEDIDCCIHLAWEGANGSARANTDIQLNNVKRTLRLCKTLSEIGVRRFVGIGTLAEKDVNNYIPTDGATPNPVSCYGTAKLATQYMSKAVCTELKIEHIWCQLSNLYGVGDGTNNFINFASKLMLTGGRPAFTPGEQMYDFVYITDIANGIYRAAKYGKNNTAYYIGSGHQQKLKEYIFKIRDTIDPSIELYLGEIPFNGVCLADEEFDSSKLINDTGYQAEVLFEEGIQKTITWLKTQMEN